MDSQKRRGSSRRPREIWQFPDIVIPFRMIIAPVHRQAQLFIKDSGYYPRECKVATRREQLHGYDLATWEVWWLDRLWPCRTREDVDRMVEFKAYARMRGADIRHWWT